MRVVLRFNGKIYNKSKVKTYRCHGIWNILQTVDIQGWRWNCRREYWSLMNLKYNSSFYWFTIFLVQLVIVSPQPSRQTKRSKAILSEAILCDFQASSQMSSFLTSAQWSCECSLYLSSSAPTNQNLRGKQNVLVLLWWRDVFSIEELFF